MIRLRGTKWQVDVYWKGERVQRQADSEEHAQILEKQLLEELKSKTPDPSKVKPWTVQDAFNKTWERCWEGKKSERVSKITAGQVVKHFGATTPLSSITTDDADAFVAKLKKEGNSGGTINRKLAALSKMLSFAVERGALEKKPFLQREDEPDGRIRYLSQEEEAKLLGTLEHWGKLDHADACRVLIDTGLRTGELWNIRSKDIHWDSSMLSVWVSKGGTPRSIPMTSRVKETLKRRAEGKLEGDRLFPFENGWIRNQWDRVKVHMGLTQDDQFVPHCMRHTCASRLAQRGLSIQKIQKWLGHKTITITLRYAHLAPADLLEGVALLEASA